MAYTELVEKMFLSPNQQEAREIKAEIDDVTIPHDSFGGAYRGIMECVMESRHACEPVNCMLLGEGGTGKTTLAGYIAESFTAEVVRENDLEITTVPVVSTSFKSMRSLDALVTDVLRKLGDPHPTTGKTPDKGDRAVELMKSCRTEVILIDELHDLEGFEEGDLEAMRPFLKWIKGITNSRGPAVCLMGTEQCKDLFANEKSLEMARRFKRRFILRRLVVGTKQEPGTLPSFLQKVCQGILEKTAVESFPPLSVYENAVRIWACTAGNPEFVMTLLKEAVGDAILANRHDVKMADLKAVWDKGILDKVSVTKFNPFSATLEQIAAAVKRSRL